MTTYRTVIFLSALLAAPLFVFDPPVEHQAGLSRALQTQTGNHLAVDARAFAYEIVTE